MGYAYIGNHANEMPRMPLISTDKRHFMVFQCVIQSYCYLLLCRLSSFLLGANHGCCHSKLLIVPRHRHDLMLKGLFIFVTLRLYWRHTGVQYDL